jgi:hypothetical protein
LAELAGAIGVVVPWTLGVAPFLTPLASAGLLLIMVGAVATHARRHERSLALLPAMLSALAAFVAYGRFTVHG